MAQSTHQVINTSVPASHLSSNNSLTSASWRLGLEAPPLGWVCFQSQGYEDTHLHSVAGPTFHHISAAAFSTVPSGSRGTLPVQTTPALCSYDTLIPLLPQFLSFNSSYSSLAHLPFPSKGPAPPKDELCPSVPHSKGPAHSKHTRPWFCPTDFMTPVLLNFLLSQGGVPAQV